MFDIPSTIKAAVQSTHAVDSLPAIPTQDWVKRCAASVSHVCDRCVVLSLVATLESRDDTIDVITSGVSISTPSSTSEHDSRAIALQDRTERLNRLGFSMPESAQSVGLVAPISAIEPSWSTTPIGRALAGVQSSMPLLHAIPIKTKHANLWLLNFIGFEQGVPQEQAQMTLYMLNALHRPLSTRAHDALSNVSNPRAWLTDREQSVLEELIEGHSVRVIAEKLGRSAHTVHDHVKNLHKKIGASSRGELIANALGHNHPGDTASVTDPVLMLFPSDQVAEFKPSHVMARPLRS